MCTGLSLSAAATPGGTQAGPERAKPPLGIRDGSMLITRRATQEWQVCAGLARGGWHRIGK